MQRAGEQDKGTMAAVIGLDSTVLKKFVMKHPLKE